MKRVWARLRSAWRTLSRSEQLSADMQDEMRFHVDMETERLVRRGLDPEEARRQAHIRFGGVQKYREHGRETLGLQWIDALALDARLGVRMLVKHRGLTLAGGFAMAVAIAIGATFFEVITEMLDPVLPLHQGERIVALQYATSSAGNPERRVLHDFVAWREELRSVEHLSAFRTVQQNLVAAGTAPEPIKVAEISASGFTVAGTPPQLGRYLLPDDEREAAAPVVVIGHQTWQTRFAADPQIVGRTIHVGGVGRLIVGVMPDGFRFPVDHQFWIPLRLKPLEHERFEGPQLYMFGRLAPGVSLESAQAELMAVAQRRPAEHPRTRQPLQPRVLPYTREHLDLSQPTLVWLLRVAQLLVGVLSFVVAVNLAILVYARTATRLGEIAVRTALGASRRRILAQLFVESLTLSIAGAAAGLALSHVALVRVQALLPANGAVPFSLQFTLSPATVAYAIGVAVFAAVIMGVLPGLKATGTRLTATLQELNGRAATRLGPMWTTLVVAQVGVAVAILPVALYLSWQVMQIELAGAGFPAERFAVSFAALGDAASTVDAGRVRQRQLELMSRLKAEPGVAAVAVSNSVPGFPGGDGRIQFEGDLAAKDPGSQDVSTIDVGVEFFDTYAASVLAGRVFNASDTGAARTVVVNRSFVERFLDRQSALGVRFHYRRPPAVAAADAQPEWHQIIGVVDDFPVFPKPLSVEGDPTVYHAAAPGDVHPFAVSVRFNGQVPEGFINRLRHIGAEVDPALQLRRAMPLTDFYDQLRAFWRHLAWGIALVTTSVLLLSAAGIYALMSFTVAQRTREIGIRAALGAHPRRLILSIFSRVIRQLGLGLLAGSLASAGLFAAADFGIGGSAVLLFAVASLMSIVGLLAAVGPARRCLRIEPSDVLRADS